MDTGAVLDLMREVAAEYVTPRFRALADHDVHEKRPGDLVTIADHEAEAAITAALLAAYPDAVILGEEAYAAEPRLMEAFRAADHAFTVDPVDGTRNFVHGSPDHAVMVAETRVGEVVRGWIWQPEYAVAWVAELGAGTWRNGERVRRAPVPSGQLPHGSASRWQMRRHHLGDLPALGSTWGACAVDYPQIIEGGTDFVLYSNSKPWDHAPGALLLREAGGASGHIDGAPYRPTATPPGLIAAADPATLDRVRAAWQSTDPRSTHPA